MTLQEILELPLNENNTGDFKEGTTVKEYFYYLLEHLWSEGESFSGKRPFGNSGWEYDLYDPLVKHGVIPGSYDAENDCIDDFDRKAANKMIFNLIAECFDMEVTD